MEYISTRSLNKVTIEEALLSGTANDGGLYLPNRIPKIDKNDFMKIDDYATFSTRMLSPYFYRSILEESLERKRKKENDPRTCDIDIIDYKGQIIDFKYKDLDFIVPHKKLIYRNFILYPLHEILPDWKHPKTKELISVLIEKLPNEDKNSILKIKKS